MSPVELRAAVTVDLSWATRTSEVAEDRPAVSPTSQDVVVVPFATDFASEPVRVAPPAFVDMVVKGGGSPELAERLWTGGITADEAKHALTLAMYSPAPENFGPARLLVEVSSWGIAQKEVSAAQVQEGFRALGHGVVVQPDGLWVRARDGEPIESSAVQVRDGRALSGGLEVGGLYVSEAGVLRAVGPGGARGAVVGELGLTQDPYSATMTGVSQTLMETAVGIGGLVDGLARDPAGTIEGLFHAFGRLPETAVAFAFEAPELWRHVSRLPAHQQQQVVGRLAGGLLLAARAAKAAGAAGRAGRAGGGGGFGLKLEVGLMELSTGHLVPTVRLQGMAAALGAPGTGAGVLLRSRDGDFDEPKVRFANEHHIGRRFGDSREVRPEIDEVVHNLKALRDGPANTRKTYAAQLRAYLETRTNELEEIEAIHDATRRWPEADRVEIDGWVEAEMKRAVAEVSSWPADMQAARVDALQAAAKRLGLEYEALKPRVAPPPSLRLIYEPNPKHGAVKRGRASAAPTRGQWALDRSVELPGPTSRRVAVDPENQEYIVFDCHERGARFHGHVRPWKGTNGLKSHMHSALQDAGLTDHMGRIK